MPHRLSSGELEATFHPEAGMVGSSLRREGRELLGLRGGLEAYRKTGATFGIPFLYPWANRLSRRRFTLAGRQLDATHARRDEHELPIHGLLGPSPEWEVVRAGETELVARHAWAGARLDAFPFPHEVELAVALTPAGLTVATTVTATDDVAVPVSFGFHPYLELALERRAEARVALPVRRRVVVDERGLPTGDHADEEPYRGPLGERTFDDCFDRLEPGRPFVLDGEQERVSVLPGEGFPVAQVFAPPGKPFLAYEPMTAPLDALVTGRGLSWAQPGSPFRAEWGLGVLAR